MMRYGYFAMLCSLFVLGGTNRAHAYLDPGAGTLIFQLLVGGVAGTATVLKLYWKKIRRSISGLDESRATLRRERE